MKFIQLVREYDGSIFQVNPDNIESIERRGTMLTLVTMKSGAVHEVRNTPDEIIGRAE